MHLDMHMQCDTTHRATLTHIHTHKRRYVDLIDSDVEPHTSYKEVEWEEDDNDDNEEKVLSTMLSCWHLNMHTCMCLALAST